MSEQLEINDKDVDDVLDFKGCDNAGDAIFYYKDAPFTGVIRAYYNDGKVRNEAEYKDGHLGGASRDYYPNGQVKFEWYINYGCLEKHFKEWDEVGNLIWNALYHDGVKTKQIIPEEE